MHEFSVAESLLKKALSVSAAHGNRPVRGVRVQIGQLRQLVPETLAFAFEALAQDTLAHGAALECVKILVKVRCRQCGATFEPGEPFWSCPACGAWGGEVLAGEELVLESVTLEDAEGVPE